MYIHMNVHFSAGCILSTAVLVHAYMHTYMNMYIHMCDRNESDGRLSFHAVGGGRESEMFAYANTETRAIISKMCQQRSATHFKVTHAHTSTPQPLTQSHKQRGEFAKKLKVNNNNKEAVVIIFALFFSALLYSAFEL